MSFVPVIIATTSIEPSNIVKTVVVDALGASILLEAQSTYEYIVDVPVTAVSEVVHDFGVQLIDDSEGVPAVPGLS